LARPRAIHCDARPNTPRATRATWLFEHARIVLSLKKLHPRPRVVWFQRELETCKISGRLGTGSYVDWLGRGLFTVMFDQILRASKKEARPKAEPRDLEGPSACVLKRGEAKGRATRRRRRRVRSFQEEARPLDEDAAGAEFSWLGSSETEARPKAEPRDAGGVECISKRSGTKGHRCCRGLSLR
jgi:hypothetical protein